ncbi:serine/threonine-protein kinase pelle [Anticarsia gemmatalis]|uniref:serine/threonine-protein kinase pelle n=1 Tax=Anticarsia gemmatalis TaxID=129554 RepID=UPI003F759F9C
MTKMYIYELPYDINKELCRLLDIEDYWKELAGNQMKYSPFDVNDIEQAARRQNTTPTEQLFTRWGQQNHTVQELFILLYKMRYVPALQCLVPLVSEDFHKLLKKIRSSGSIREKSTGAAQDKSNKKSTQKTDGSFSSIPLPVMLIEKGVQQPTTSRIQTSPNYESSTDISKSSSTASKGTNNDDDEIMKNVSAIPKMSYEDLKEATNGWSEDNLLGRGGFGQVFKGEWKHLPVAVKRLQRDDDGRNKELIREMCLNQYRHDNILPLYGYCLGGPEACLVYQLMAGGSLEQRLRGKTHHPPLTWSQRYSIAHGVARGLQFLHTMAGTPLIHGDIKPANILLDQCLMPKIGDFGLARKGPYGEDRTHLKVSRVYGTRPYLPDEYLRSHCLSPAVDVYSYGVVMVEMATALPAIDRQRKVQLLSAHMHVLHKIGTDPATLEDPVIRNTPLSDPRMCREFFAIGLHCTMYERRERPTMLQVYKQLDAMQIPANNFI